MALAYFGPMLNGRASAASVRCLISSFCCWATRVALTLRTACRNWRNPSAEASGTLE